MRGAEVVEEMGKLGVSLKPSALVHFYSMSLTFFHHFCLSRSIYRGSAPSL
jgi:hypothetical protein